MTLEEAIELANERAEDGCGTCNACTGCSGCKDVKDEFEEIAKFLTELKGRREHPKVRHGRWLNTDETVWDAKDIDGKQQLEISIVAAKCSVCERWSEQVNSFPPYMKYELCPHCGADMR